MAILIKRIAQLRAVSNEAADFINGLPPGSHRNTQFVTTLLRSRRGKAEIMYEVYITYEA